MLDYKDITEELCILCGACCSIYIPITGDARYINFIKEIGLPYIEENSKTLRLYLGPCPKLKEIKEGDITKYYCTIYQNRPQLCRDFNCVAWAKVSNKYENSQLVKKAIESKKLLKKLIEKE